MFRDAEAERHIPKLLGEVEARGKRARGTVKSERAEQELAG